MSHRPEHIKRLTSEPTETGAGIIVAALEQNGIKATFAGEATSGFRVEAPGWVQVLVAEEDMPLAQAILDDVRQRRGDDVDWATVDVGEPEGELPEPAAWWMSFKVWRRIAVIIVVIYLIYFLAGFGGLMISTLLRALGFGQ